MPAPEAVDASLVGCVEERPVNTKVWTTRNGDRVRIKDMGDHHLRRTMAMIERMYAAMLDEAINRTEELATFFDDESMASVHTDWNLEKLYEERKNPDPARCFPIYRDMVEEAAARKARQDNVAVPATAWQWFKRG